MPDSDRWSQGGWGYVVAGSAFMAAFLLDGMESSYGILMPSLLEDLGGSVSVTSFTGGLVTGTALFIGPAVSSLIERFGCRPVAFVGGLTCSLSLALATLSVNWVMFMVFYGICTGLGIGMVYMCYNTVVNIYFDRKRSVAMGLVTSGSGVGILVMALLINALISIYGWRGCYLILAAIFAHLCAIALIMRPLKPLDMTLLQFSEPVRNVQQRAFDESENYSNVCQSDRVSATEHGNIISSSDSDRLMIQRENPPIRSSPADDDEICLSRFSCHHSETLSPSDNQKAASDSANQKAASGHPARTSYWPLLTDPVFLLFCYGSFSFQLAFAITPMFTPSYALHIGLTPSQAASTVSVIGICNMSGRVLAGVLSFYGLGSIRVHVLGTFLAGLVCFLVPWCATYFTLVLFAASHGFFLGVFFPLQSVLLVEILGIEQLVRAFGVSCLCRSFASSLGPFLAGMLYEQTQDHTLPFLLSGFIIVFASLLQIILAVLLRHPCRQKPEQSHVNS